MQALLHNVIHYSNASDLSIINEDMSVSSS